MQCVDIAIVGGGVVGLSAALALKDSGLSVLVIERGTGPQIPAQTDLGQRVSALNLASEAFLRHIQVWPDIASTEKSMYRTMSVWEGDSFGEIAFDADSILHTHLGHIVENAALHHALWYKVQDAQWITLAPNTHLEHVTTTENGVLFTVQGMPFAQANLSIAADGAHSWLREKMHIPRIERDYNHSALICAVRAEHGEARRAYQVFRPQGPLAFLPLSRPNHYSIVWSGPPEQLHTLAQGSLDALERALFVYSDGRLGTLSCQQTPQVIPLRARYAKQFVQERCILIGDAAHTIHPLAGLGLNLGLMDAAALAQTLMQHHKAGKAIDAPRALRRFERARKTHAIRHLTVMEGLKQLFSGDSFSKKMLRSTGLLGVNALGPCKRYFICEATGLRESGLPFLDDYVQMP